MVLQGFTGVKGWSGLVSNSLASTIFPYESCLRGMQAWGLGSKRMVLSKKKVMKKKTVISYPDDMDELPLD
jgi:hypothetical protein